MSETKRAVGDALVLGAGVIGLSAAIRLAESGRRVRVWARDLPENTTSSIAAAIWYPYKAAPVERVREWSRRTCEALCALASRPESGVFLAEGRKLFHRPMGDPWWRDFVPAWRRLGPEELPDGVRAGYAFTVPIADMSKYLGFLVTRLDELGTRIEARRATLDEALAASPVVVNCTGLGAREVADDLALYPIRGQILRTSPIGRRDFLIDSDHPSGLVYVIPRLSDCILGGVAEDDVWELAPDPTESEAIVARCAALVPEAGAATVLEARVGLRPGREAVRLEAEPRPDGLVVHDYGHGGAGVTLSWGTAEEVVALVDRHEGKRS